MLFCDVVQSFIHEPTPESFIHKPTPAERMQHSGLSSICPFAGPGAFDFRQGDSNGTLFWDVVRSFIHKPTPEQNACHAPKPILLDTGNLNFPYPW